MLPAEEVWESGGGIDGTMKDPSPNELEEEAVRPNGSREDVSGAAGT